MLLWINHITAWLGIKWPLLDPLYIKGEKQDGIDSWIKFFEKIGIHVGVAVQQVETRIAEVCKEVILNVVLLLN